MNESQLPVTLHVGKEGITSAVVLELKTQVRKRRIVKVRLLPSTPGFDSTRLLSEELARQSGTRLLEVRGHTALFGDARQKRDSTRKPGVTVK